MIAGYERHSPSALNLFAASPSMFVLERVLGFKQPANAKMNRGLAVEDGVTVGLLEPTALLSTCTDVALTRYDTLMALSPDDRREKYRDDIPNMVEQTLDELRPYGVPSQTQGFIEWRPDGLQLPVVGFYDYRWQDSGLIVDLKTTEKMPSEIKIGHARQVAFYAMSDNMDARLTYVTPKKCQTYRLENVRAHRSALYQIALRVENFLALSEDPEFFKSITVPDLDNFLWSGPVARQLAFEHWCV